MYSTPDFSHLSSADYIQVYEPAEDTFLLIDALESDVSFLKESNPLICLEVGCGSGVVSTFIAKMLGPSVIYFCTDINAFATSAAQRTAHQNTVTLNPVVCDLFVPAIAVAINDASHKIHLYEVEPLLPRLQRSVDVVLFNPPYVVTPPDEVGSSGIEASWAGGLRGRQVMDRLFPLVPFLLSDTGVFYLVIVKENDQEDICRVMSSLGLSVAVVLTRRTGPELLTVLRCTRIRVT